MTYSGGQRGIRTPEGLATSTVFKTVAFNHSAICPKLCSAGLSTYGFVRWSHLSVLLTIRTIYFANLCFATFHLQNLTHMQDRRIQPLCHLSWFDDPPILYYFFRNATVNIAAPAKNIIPDSNCPMVKPQLVRNPI